MKVLNRHTENTGGGCMITYVDVSNCDDVVQFGIDEEAIVAYRKRYGDTEENMSEHFEWIAYTDKELRQYLSNDEADVLIDYLIDYCFRFNVHPTFELQPVVFDKYRLDYVARNIRTHHQAAQLEFIKQLDKIAADTNADGNVLVASIQPLGPAVSLDLDADVYVAMRGLLFDNLMSDFF